MSEIANQIRTEINNIFKTMKIEKCAAEMGVATSTAYRYQQPKNNNGEVIPLLNLIALNKLVAEQGLLDALKSAYVIAQAIVKPLGAKVVDGKLVAALNNGIPLRALIQPKEIIEAGEICSNCKDVVRFLPFCRCRWNRS